MLESDFVLGWKNIRKEHYVGQSRGYHKKQTAIGTTNGAGPRNTQMFVLAPDLTVLHALPGFWHPQDLVRELRFAKQIAMLWSDDRKTPATKEKMFQRMHRREVYTQPVETFERSTWQHFDAFAEQRRMQEPRRDTFLRHVDGSMVLENGAPKLKPINVLVHERMARRPFQHWDDFDIAAFVDYGLIHYDNNAMFDRTGRKFSKRKNKKRKPVDPKRVVRS